MSGDDTKNPHQEAENPAPVVNPRPLGDRKLGPNTQSNEPHDLDQDPEGQQGGTDGGSKRKSPLRPNLSQDPALDRRRGS